MGVFPKHDHGYLFFSQLYAKYFKSIDVTFHLSQAVSICIKICSFGVLHLEGRVSLNNFLKVIYIMQSHQMFKSQ